METVKCLHKAYLCLLMVLICACSNQYIGQVLPPGDYLDMSRSTHHRMEHQLLIMDYQCHVDRRAGYVTFDGKIMVKKKKGAEDWLLDSLLITVYFMNPDRKVIAVDYIEPESETLNTKFTKFRKRFKYNPEFKYVTHSYECKATIRNKK